jgi:hypothetical protein
MHSKDEIVEFTFVHPGKTPLQQVAGVAAQIYKLLSAIS